MACPFLARFFRIDLTLVRIFFCGLLLVFSCTVRASIFEGWIGNYLIGVSAGYIDLYGEIDTTLTYHGREFRQDIFQASYNRRNFTNSSFVFGVLAGYQEIYREWLVGVEINFDFQALDKESKFILSDLEHEIDWSSIVHYQRKNMIGISGRLGYAVTPYCMPYVRLGGEFSRDKFIGVFQGDFNVFPHELVIGERHWIHCFLLGIGAEIPLMETCGATIRLEYTFHSKARTMQGFAVFTDRIFVPSIQTGMQPRMQSARLSFIWNFF